MSVVAGFIFTIGLLVFIHELGHFLVARWCGVRVEAFALGFGPALFSFVRGETRYSVRLLPLGGYVKMAGEGTGALIVENADEKSSFKSGDRIISIGGKTVRPGSRWEKLSPSVTPGTVVGVERNGEEISVTANGSDGSGNVRVCAESDYPRSFSKKSVGRRMAIVLAGPVMNFALPFALLPLALFSGVKSPAYTVEEPVAVRTVGEIRKGDRIVSINGRETATWDEVSAALGSGALENETVTAEILRENGRKETVTGGWADFAPPVLALTHETVIGAVSPGSPAEAAGIKAGDRVVSVAGKTVKLWDDMAKIIRENGGKEIEIVVVRNGKTVRAKAVPAPGPGGGALIGVAMDTGETVVKRFGVFESVTRGFARAAEMTVGIIVLFFGLLASLFGGEMSLSQAGQNLAGPVFIAKLSGGAASEGFGHLLNFASVISVNLAVINLLPIHCLASIFTGRLSSRLYVAYAPLIVFGTLLAGGLAPHISSKLCCSHLCLLP